MLFAGRVRIVAAMAVLIGLAVAVSPTSRAFALIEGGEGNRPIENPRWPDGAAEVFNHPARIAYWEGPPLGGGQWHGEYRGDTETLNVALAAFAKLDVRAKRVVVHDGIGQSTWLNINGDPEKREKARIDWSFAVWEPDGWDRARQLPAEFNPIDPREAEDGPPATIDVYTGGSIRFEDMAVPPGIELVDERLVAHGFTAEDGIVLQGRVTDLDGGTPLAAQVSVRYYQRNPDGASQYDTREEVATDGEGRWTLVGVPEGRCQVVAEAEGYVSRVVAYERFDGQPGWHGVTCELARGGSIAGRVADESGRPLTEVAVSLMSASPTSGGRYPTPSRHAATTDAEGRFRIDTAPIGTARVRARKSGYCQPGLGPETVIPADGVELTMMKSGTIRITVDFAGVDRPEEYLVDLEPEAGSTVGSYGGSARVDANNQHVFRDVRPGRYVVKGHPNPYTPKDVTEPEVIELERGQAVEVTLRAVGN